VVHIRPVPELQVPVQGSERAQVLLRHLLQDNVPPVVRRVQDSAMFREG
jgi:hypothetical protein